ncbi:MAG: Si-specific NAD(P)(+) transhydrogenase, partial [Bdellovibrionota bacterium]
DVIGAPALAASSSEQGRLAARHAFDVDCPPFSKLFPYGIYTIPEISSVGAQETDLIKDHIPYVIGRARYSELARGQILGDEHGLLKILVSKENHKILGVHILGTGATELIHIGQTAMHFEGTIEFFVSNIFNYPTLAEAYKVAALNAQNQL